MSDTENALNPFCQTADCDSRATNLLASRKSGMELHLCSECASRYHEQGWKLIDGEVELQ